MARVLRRVTVLETLFYNAPYPVFRLVSVIVLVVAAVLVVLLPMARRNTRLKGVLQGEMDSHVR